MAKELTEAEQYAAEEKARVEAIEAQKQKDEEAAKTADPKSGASDAQKPEAKPAVAKPATKPATARARGAKAKPKDRTEVYEQRGPAGLYKVTRNIETGETAAELIEE